MTTIKDIDPDGRFAIWKKRESDAIFWIDDVDHVGGHWFTFDKVTVFNVFEDYPHNLTPDQKAIFDAENPFWKDFFTGRR